MFRRAVYIIPQFSQSTTLLTSNKAFVVINWPLKGFSLIIAAISLLCLPPFLTNNMAILILFIDDNTMIRENVEEILILEGYRVVTADCGLTGLGLATALIPDLIICDILMSGMDGYEVLVKLKDNPKTNHIPFVFSTSKSESSDKEKAKALGGKSYLVKPFDLYDLIKCIKESIN